MSTYGSGLTVATFSIGGNNLLAYLDTGGIAAENKTEDGRGIADRYEYEIATKQSQSIDFTTMLSDATTGKQTGLSLSLWSIGGTDYLGLVQQGTIDISCPTSDRSGIATFVDYPVSLATQVTVTCDQLVLTSSAYLKALIDAADPTFQAAVSITYGTETFTAPMMVKSSKVSLSRGKFTMEKATFSLRGTPTGPSDTTLMGLALIGSDEVAFSVDTGVGTYSSASGGTAAQACITKLTTTFNNGAITKQTGTISIQGAMTAA